MHLQKTRLGLRCRGDAVAMVTAEDFDAALERVKPSSMAEFRLQVPTHLFADFVGIDDVIDDLKVRYDWMVYAHLNDKFVIR